MSERRPVAGWEFDAYENRWKNYVGGYVLVVWLRVCKDDAGNPTHGWMVARVADEDDDVERSRDIDSFDLDAAKLAAEDAAADLLLAGLRALGRVA